MEDKCKFVQDDSCHWYIIPLHLEEEFEKFAYGTEEEQDELFSKFDKMRSDSPSRYTFYRSDLS